MINNLHAVCELTNAGCCVTFHQHGCEVEYKGEIVLQGWRDPTNKLWHVSWMYYNTNNLIPPTPTVIDIGSIIQHTTSPCQIHNIYECTNFEELIRFYHGCLYYPSETTWIAAICSGYFWGWSGLTASAINCHIKTIKSTVQGHLNQHLQGLHSNKAVIDESSPYKHSPSNAPILSPLPLKNNPENYTATKLEDSTTL